MPSLATIGDETADGEFDFGPERPLALFDAPRVDYSLRRLVHYTGSDWRAMQPWVLLTNYHRYVDQFVQWGLKQLHAGTGVEKVILPGNVVINSSISPAEAERAWRARSPGIGSRCPPIIACAPTGGGSVWSTSASGPRTPRRSPTISRSCGPIAG